VQRALIPYQGISQAKNKIQSTGVCINPVIKMQYFSGLEHTNTIVFKTIAIVKFSCWGWSWHAAKFVRSNLLLPYRQCISALL